MTAAESQIPEDHEAALLAAYDEALAAGQTPSLDEQALSGLGTDTAELRVDLACLELLAQKWPRRRVPQGNGLSIHPHGPGRMTQLGRFRLLCELGRGGHGIVYLAVDPALGRQVALKVPRPEILLTPDLRQASCARRTPPPGWTIPAWCPSTKPARRDRSAISPRPTAPAAAWPPGCTSRPDRWSHARPPAWSP